MIRFIFRRLVVAFFVLVFASINSMAQVEAATSLDPLQNRIISYFGTNYKPDAVVTKKIFSLVSRKLKKEDKRIKSVTVFSNTPATYDFAITKLCTAESWEVTRRNYTNCRNFAQNHGFLDAPLNPSPTVARTQSLTYSNLAILLARTVNYKKGITHASAAPQTQTSPVLPTSNATPPTRVFSSNPSVAFEAGTYDVHYFSTIELDEPLPKTFYAGEMYFINGVIRSGATSDIFAFTCDPSTSCASTTNYLTSTKGDRFSIPVYFNTPGVINLGIVPGRSGESRLATLNVLPEEPTMLGKSAAATGLKTEYRKGVTTLSWNANGFKNSADESHFSRVVIYQGSRRADFIFRQNITSFAPSTRYFKSFSEGPASFLVDQNGTVSTPVSISLTTLHFYKEEKTSISNASFSERFSSPSTLTFSGKAAVTLSNKIAVTMPNGFVKLTIVAPQNFAPGSLVSFSIPLPEAGTYIFEINDISGAAAINAPIYVGNLTPLLPDFFELHEQKLDTTTLSNLDQARATMLALINKDRREQGLSAVTIDSQLNTLAQSHSQNMLDHNFFSHTDHQNRSPDARRRAFNIPTPIRENLGKSNSLEHVEAGLMRSPIHRDTVLDSRMKRVGIGITKTSDGYYLVTQNYTGDALSVQNMIDLKTKLLEHVASFRRLKSLQGLNEDPATSRAAVEWASTMSAQNFFALTCPANKPCDHQSVSAAVRAQGVTGGFEVYTVRTSDESSLIDEILSEPAVADGSYSRIGMGFGVGSFGEVYLVVIYL